MKKCPTCAEEIQDEAIKCKHCGELLQQSGVAVQKKDTHKKTTYMAISIGLFLVLVQCFGYLYISTTPIHTAQNLIFHGTTKTIGVLLKEHPQVKNVQWQEMPVLGEGIVVATVTFGGAIAGGKNMKQVGYITIKCVKHSGKIISIKSTLGQNGENISCQNQGYFFSSLENKTDLALGFLGSAQ